MRTCTYSDAYNDWLSCTGLDDSAEPESIKKGRFLTFFNERLRKIWRAGRWPFVLRVENVYVCKFGVIIFPEGSEIDYSDKFELYDKDPRSGWGAKILPYKFDGEKITIGDNLWSTAEGAPYESSKSYSVGDVYELEGKIYAVISEGGNKIELSGFLIAENWLESESIEVGDCVLFNSGEKLICKICTSNDVFVELKTIPFKKTAWLKYRPLEPVFSISDTNKTFPYAFKAYIIEGAKASWYGAQNRTEERNIAESVALDALEEELLRLYQNPNVQ